MGVVTSLPGWLAELLISERGLRQYFDAFVHAGNCRSRKPHPTPILAALRMLGPEPGHSMFYVGDSELDAQAASAAGVSFAWASYGYGAVKPKNAVKVLHLFEDVLLL